MSLDYEKLISDQWAWHALIRVVARGTTLGTARAYLEGMVEVDHLTDAHAVGNQFVSAKESIDQIQC